jgi:hypothetical protein
MTKRLFVRSTGELGLALYVLAPAVLAVTFIGVVYLHAVYGNLAALVGMIFAFGMMALALWVNKFARHARTKIFLNYDALEQNHRTT